MMRHRHTAWLGAPARQPRLSAIGGPPAKGVLWLVIMLLAGCSAHAPTPRAAALSPVEYAQALPPRWQYVFSARIKGLGEADYFLDRETLSRAASQRAFWLRVRERGSAYESIDAWQLDCAARTVSHAPGRLYAVGSGIPLAELPAAPLQPVAPESLGEHLMQMLCRRGRTPTQAASQL
jgi:hypothetical protein